MCFFVTGEFKGITIAKRKCTIKPLQKRVTFLRNLYGFVLVDNFIVPAYGNGFL